MASKEKNSKINPRKEIDQWESSLRNVFYVLSVKKNLFSVSLMRVVKVIYMFNLTNIGLNMCVKRIFGFISEFDNWTRANPDIYVGSSELSRMAGKVYDSTRMAGKDWENTHMAG